MLLLKKLLQASQLNTPKWFPVATSLQTRQTWCCGLVGGEIGSTEFDGDGEFCIDDQDGNGLVSIPLPYPDMGLPRSLWY